MGSLADSLKKKGYTDQQIAALFGSFGPRQAPKPKKNVADYLPLIGGIAGSFIPGAGTIIGGALGSAAGAALKQGVKKEQFNPGEILKEGAFGLAGGVAGKGLGAAAKLLGAGGKAATQGAAAGAKGGLSSLGLSLQKTAVKPTVALSPFAAEGEEGIIKGLTELGLKGTPEQIRRKLPSVMRSLSTQIDDVLGKANTTVSKASVKSSLDKALSNSIEFDKTIPGFASARDKFFNQLGKAGEKTMTAKELFSFKQSLGSQLKRAFDLQAKGGALSPAQHTGIALWESVDDIITKKVPAVKELTLKQSTLFKAAPGLKKAADEVVRMPIFGTPLPGVSAAGKTVAGATGRALSKAGDRLSSAAFGPVGMAAEKIGGQAFVRPGAFEQPQEQTMEDPMSALGLGGGEDLSQAPQQGLLSEQDLMELISMDLEASGGKNIDTIKEFYSMLGGGGGMGDLSAAQEKTLIGSDTASRIVDQIENELSQLPSGRIAGTGAKIAGKFGGSDLVKAYEDSRNSKALMLIKAIQGSAGNISDADRQAIVGSIPSTSDTPGERRAKLQSIRQLIQAYMQGATSISGGGQGGAADILTQLGL